MEVDFEVKILPEVNFEVGFPPLQQPTFSPKNPTRTNSTANDNIIFTEKTSCELNVRKLVPPTLNSWFKILKYISFFHWWDQNIWWRKILLPPKYVFKMSRHFLVSKQVDSMWIKKVKDKRKGLVSSFMTKTCSSSLASSLFCGWLITPLSELQAKTFQRIFLFGIEINTLRRLTFSKIVA